MKKQTFYKTALAGSLILGLTVSLLPTTAEAVTGSQTAKDGQYSWESRVSNPEGSRWEPYKVTVSLSVADGRFSAIEITPDESFYKNEGSNDFFLNKAKDDFCTSLQGKPATEESIQQWDAVSGATCASNGMKRAALLAIGRAEPVTVQTPAPTGTPEPTITQGVETAMPTALPTITQGAQTVTPTAMPTITQGAQTVTPTAMPTITPTVTPIAATPAPVTPGVTSRPGKVNLTQVKGMKRAVQLKWKKVKGAAGYKVYRASSKNGVFKKIKTLKKVTVFKDRSVTSKKTYYYRVCAYRTVKGKTVTGSRSSVKGATVK